MSESRWRNWVDNSVKTNRGFRTFMEGRAAEEARKAGLVSDFYGRWKNPETGEVIAKTVGDRLVYLDADEVSNPGARDPEADMGNPTSAASGLSPADRARALGLQSDGSGGYVDPQTGQVAARTVNGELVFYDSRGSGGAVSDGAGGQAMVQSQPSWKDPVTGVIIVPPAKPETPYEYEAIPAAVPAQSPMGFQSFLDQKRKEMYDSQAAAAGAAPPQEAEAELEQETEAEESPAMANYREEMQDVIGLARESGDEEKIIQADKAEKLINSDEFKKEVQEYFELAPEDKQEDILDLAIELAIVTAKNERAEELLKEIDDNDSLSEEERKKQTNELLDKRDYDFPHVLKKEIEDIVGEFRSSDPEVDEYPEEEKRYDGDKIFYDLKSVNPYGSDLAPFDYDDVEVEAKNILKDNGNPSGIKGLTRIDWYNQKEGEIPNSEKKSNAFDALKVWRRQVLPDLKPGTVVYNAPMEGGRGDNARERIYTLAGFGPLDKEKGVQLGVVVQDEQGKNKVVPIGEEEGGRRRRRVAESIMWMLDDEINNFEEYRLMESLFHGL